MINDEVIELAEQFRADWGSVLGRCDAFVLDYSWPSVGVLDYLLFHLRAREKYSKVERDMIRSAAAYLACMAHDSWSEFSDDLKVSVEKEGGVEFEIIIRAHGGALFTDEVESFEVKVVNSLRRALEFRADATAYFAKKIRLIKPTQNLVSLFSLGLFTGLTPYGEGLWANFVEEDFIDGLTATNNYLAGTCAAYYKTLYPNEELGQSPVLYLSHLVLPPAMHSEQFPATRAVTGVVSYLKHCEASPEKMLDLAENLASSPDELIRWAGFATACALCDGKPSVRLRAVAESMGSMTAELRPAVITARELLELPSEPLALVEQGQDAEAKKLIELERMLHITPLYRLSKKRLSEVGYKSLVNALCWFNPIGAKEAIVGYGEGETNKDIVLLGIYLDVMMGKLEAAKDGLKMFEENLQDSNYPERYFYFEIKAIMAVINRKKEDAVRYYRLADGEQIENHLDRFSILNHLAKTLVQTFQYKSALQVLEEILEQEPYSTMALVYKAACHEELGDDEALKETIEKGLEHGFLDRRMFGFLMK